MAATPLPSSLRAALVARTVAHGLPLHLAVYEVDRAAAGLEPVAEVRAAFEDVWTSTIESVRQIWAAIADAMPPQHCPDGTPRADTIDGARVTLAVVDELSIYDDGAGP